MKKKTIKSFFLVEEGISTIANVKNFLSLRMGRGRAGYIQNNEYLITAMFQSRVYMIRKSIVKHIYTYLWSKRTG